MLSLNLSMISGMNLDVVKMFTPHLAWRSKVSDRNLAREPSVAWDSSIASTMTKTLEYRAATEWRVLEISWCDRLALSWRDLTLSGIDLRP
jgi:hypothetical protein